MGLSSNILWHQTNEKGFYEILKSKRLRYSYCLEKVIPSFNLAPIAFPMISVSDYPFSEIGNNQWTYGNYCIGFKQNWGVKSGFSPVWYFSLGSRGLRQLDILLEDALATESKGRFGAIMYLFANMKFVQAPLKTKGHEYKRYRFYDEREWRIVPYITETDSTEYMPFLTEESYIEYKKQHCGNSLLDIGVDFGYDDIKYIIVENERDIIKTCDFVGDKIHIFSKNEVVEDFLGVQHHNEVLPSIEHADSEAAQRYVERLVKKAHEVFEKKNESKQ